MPKRKRSGVYRSIRHGKTVERAYVGSFADPVVRALERTWHLQSVGADVEQQQVSAEIEVVASTEGGLQLLASQASRVIRALRKRFHRGKGVEIVRVSGADDLPSREDYDELVAEAAAGSEEALDQLRRVLAKNPVLYRLLGDFSRHLRRHLIEHVSGGSPDTREAMQLFLAERREQLLAEGDSLIEQMLVDQVLVTMVDATFYHVGYLQPHGTEKIKDRWRRYLAKAQQRHQAALTSLVEARSMIWRARASPIH